MVSGGEFDTEMCGLVQELFFFFKSCFPENVAAAKGTAKQHGFEEEQNTHFVSQL
jgi:hypothetical protein